MAEVSRKELMLYCRVDDEDAGDLLESLADSAEEYLQTAGVELDEFNNSRYCLAEKALVLHWFDNPTGGDLPAGLRQIINQLKFSNKRGG